MVRPNPNVCPEEPAMTDKAPTTLTFAPQGSPREVEHGHVFQPRFDGNGLIAAIVADARTGDVLMLAWMNAEALSLTISTREAHFYSRSRRKIWKKGEDSGNVLHVQEILADCDQDALLIRAHVAGNGVACHTGARSCFYRALTLDASHDAPQMLGPAKT